MPGDKAFEQLKQPSQGVGTDEIRALIRAELLNYRQPQRTGDHDQAYKLEPGIGMQMGKGNFDDANFSVDFDGNAKMKTPKTNPYTVFGQFNSGNNGVAVSVSSVMTGQGRYILVPTTTAWSVWDSFASYNFNYTRAAQFSRTTTVVNAVNTRVVDEFTGTERVLGFAQTGTTCYGYDADGQNEVTITISGVTLTGAQRMGYNQTSKRVYLMNGSDKASTTIYRFRFYNNTLTYVDTITLSAAPATGGCNHIWIGSTYLVFSDAATSNALAVYQRYAIATGTIASSVSWGNTSSSVIYLGNCTREDDNGFMHWQETSADAAAWTGLQRLILE